MARAVECSDDELPDLTALLKQPARQRARREASTVLASRPREHQDMDSVSTTGRRRVRRLESKASITSGHLFRQWDPDRDGIVFAPRTAPPGTDRTSEAALQKQKTSNNKGAKGAAGADPTSQQGGMSKDANPQYGDLTLNRPQTGRATADKMTTIPTRNLKEGEGASKLIKSRGEISHPKSQTTTKLDVDVKSLDEDLDSSSECSTIEDDSSEYQDSDHSDSSSIHVDPGLPLPPSSRACRIPREVSKQRRGFAVDGRNPSPRHQHQPSRSIRQRKPGTGEEEKGKSKWAGQQNSPLQRRRAFDDGGTGRDLATHHDTLDLATDLSKLKLLLEESSDGYHTPVETENVKGPRLTPRRRDTSTGLNSPRKQARIPATPHKPNADIFWSQEFVDDWNDQHSPRKLGHADLPAKEKVKSGQKKETKKSFAARKDQIARDLLSQLDNRITEGKLTELAAATGGIKIVWSKTLNTTAGRANWRRETIRTTSGSAQLQVPIQFKHHASIELAEKVIDREDRLLNVLAHEFCHLANFMINGITTNPHGTEFKAWAAKCSREFAAQGIKVTTKHTYEIDFKYVWTCDACKAQYKRHSKSIDPSRHRCGSCKGMLSQTKPVPRGAGTAGTKPSEYQIFMKEHMKIVRSENPGSPQKEVMKMVAERWSKRVQATGNEATKSSEIVKQFVDLSLEDGQEEP